MSVWETEDELSGAAVQSLPTLSDTPYRTPSRSSRRSHRSVTPPAISSSSPPPMPSEKVERNAKRASKDITSNENISIFDPRRFTPTLHANLVSEILTLRRDQEEKLKFIESLESSLHSTREEHESLQTTALNTAKESRSLKRQLALLEGGTSSALGELAKERDEAVEAFTETKKRLETAQKKIRTQEEDSQRVHDLWAKEKDDWEEEKRKYERKLHVADTRLKTILDEVASAQAAQLNGPHSGVESEAEDGARENDGTSVRSMSMTNSIRFSMMAGKVNGHSLADELNFDDTDYETDPDGRQSAMDGRQSVMDGRQSVMSNARHMRNQSRDSIILKSPPKTHRRNRSSESQMRPGSVARGRLFMNLSVLDRLENGIREDDETPPAPKPEYKDTGIQFSPPPSPKLAPTKPCTLEPAISVEKPVETDIPAKREWEIEANQRRKRVHINRPAPIEPPSMSKLMVSASSQTSAEPLSPPRTPKTPIDVHPAPLPAPAPAPVVEAKPVPQMMSSATQTDAPPPPPLNPAPAPVTQFMQPPLAMIPSISIHPPTSRPATPREHRLPQYVKDFGCQVSILGPVSVKSSGMQTDEIRIDKRLDRLPAHLHPSAITSRPNSPKPPGTVEDKNFTPLPGNVPPRNPRRLASKRSFTSDFGSSPPVSPGLDDHRPTRDAYPGNNDDGPLSSHKAPMRRPHRISSLFAGFEAQSSDGDEFADADMSDLEFRTALSAPKPKGSFGRHGKRVASGASSTLEQVPLSRQSRSLTKSTDVFSLPEGRETLVRKPSVRPADKPASLNTASRASAMRKSALIQSGIVSHQGRARSPSFTDVKNPPFPIPTRASSRQPPMSASAPSDGQRSPIRMDGSWHRRGHKAGPSRSNSIRKTRSAVALPRNNRHRRQGSRSSPPPPMSPSEEAPESPGLPPLPSNDITTPRRDYAAPRYRGHRPQPSTTTAVTETTNVGSVGSSQQASGVVDAIAQTMVGEWMFKYVRRRRSFGMADTKGEENSNDRHKRWVWLAPYERAILWSGKQPSSGSALMGKSGRKLTIQSVLDVKDDNPAPKGANQIFNRSILILTPQRALKFTTVNAERHYLWLTSLSFLAHSAQSVPENIVAAPPPQAKLRPVFDTPPPPPPTKSRKMGIRDSIMLKKSKSPVQPRAEPMPNSQQFEFEDALVFKPEAFAPMPTHQRELSKDVAEPPFIPRYHERSTERVHERANQVVLHGRKRSNTGGHIPPPLSFRGFSGPVGHGTSYHAATNSATGNSIGTAGSSDIYTQGSSNGNTASGWAISSAASQRTSEASSRPGQNFFEAIGTVRMEAFISPLAFPRFDEYPDEHEEMRYRVRRRSKEQRRRRSRSRQRDSHNSRTTRGTDDWYGGNRTAPEEDYFRDDPFKGF
ncbi:uncharacterized protein BCR38DRAFT_455614 [Pseudomassariella vexata]|uniref:Pleckstrin homology domain-containing protein n=1 Tax=Pseudomassariella vexata TaxID=1141098 RepID=A0A1Y2ED47_9PEZI|nr:uncharacterized protein BCR38DRAFT_455614 [Pseudomassariella vexata]ORY68735.1 hypothetical protein BCR38DRAFT_455614 [Pseudomassariella vexata]